MVKLFEGRTMVIATMHGKEQVVAPILEQALGVQTILPENFDTDFYGTFSGEKTRDLDSFETAKAKAKAACVHSGCTLGVASEGSFGPHPTLYFMPADDEVMVLVDLQNDICIRARVISTTTNFSGAQFSDLSSVKEFAEKVGFPEHGLILRKKAQDVEGLVKGIDSWILLVKNVLAHLSRYGSVFVETDMRAMHNPLRMKVIEKVTHKLVEMILNDCPRCKTPGYDICEVVQGLQCSACGSATKSTLAYQYKCRSCNYSSIKEFPNGKELESPQFCDYCNP